MIKTSRQLKDKIRNLRRVTIKKYQPKDSIARYDDSFFEKPLGCFTRRSDGFIIIQKIKYAYKSKHRCSPMSNI